MKFLSNSITSILWRVASIPFLTLAIAAGGCGDAKTRAVQSDGASQQPQAAAAATSTTATATTAPAPAAPVVSATLPPVDRVLSAAPGFGREAASVVDLLEKFHYNRSAVKPSDYGDVIPNFMTNWDGQHIFFLESDKAAFLNRYSTRWVYNNLYSLGNVEPAYEVFAVFYKRVSERINWVLAKLDTDIDLAGDDTYMYDRKDVPWPATIEDADTLWTQRLKNELIGELINKKSLEDAKKDLRKRYQRWLKNFSEVEAKDISESYLSTVGALYDPHTSYMSAETLEDFTIGIKAQLIGIGAVLMVEDDYCVINEIVTGGPADLSKQLQPKDKIIAVAEDDQEAVDVIGMQLRKVVQLIRGKKGTKVHLTIIPASDPSQRKQIVIVRDVISLDAARARGAIYEVPAPGGEGGTVPIGVITLPGFYDAGLNDKGEPSPSATQDIAKLIKQFQETEKGIKGLVLDLRSNGGGLLTEAINLTGLFVKAGPVVQVKNSYGQVQVDSSKAPDPLYTGPLAVLVNRFSASASEIVAGALQNYGRAIIIGDSTTHGKGSVQQLLDMKQVNPALARLNSKTGAVKLTIQKYYLPSGDSTQLKGVVSDIPLPSIDEYLPVGEKSLPHALAWDEIASSKFNGQPLNADLLNTLRNASKKRQGELEEFSYLRKNIDWFKTRQDEKTVSLNLDNRLAQKADDKVFKKAQDEERNRLAKNTGYASREFLLTPPKPKNRKTALKDTDGDKTKDAAKPGETAPAPDGETDAPDAKPVEPRPLEESAPEGPSASNGAGREKSSLHGAHIAGSTDQPTASNDPAAKPVVGGPDDETPKKDSAEPAGEDEGGLSDEQLEEDAKILDIHLRETLRVLSDAIGMAENPGPGHAADPAPLTAAAVKRK